MEKIYSDGNYSIEVSTDEGIAVLLVGTCREDIDLYPPPMPITEGYQQQIIRKGKNPEDFFCIHDANGVHIIRRAALPAWEKARNEYDAKRRSDPTRGTNWILFLNSLLDDIQLETSNIIEDTNNPEIKQLMTEVTSTIEKWKKRIDQIRSV